MAGFLGEGDVQIAAYVNGVKQPYRRIFQVEKFTTKTESEVKSWKKKGRGVYGQLGGSVALPGESTFAFELREMDADTLKVFLMAASGTVTNQAAATVTDQPLTATKGKWVSLGKMNIDPATFALKSTGATPVTYVAGTDYELDAVAGEVMILEASAIAEGAALTVTFNANEMKYEKFRAGSNPGQKYSVRFQGTNLDSGKPVVYEAVEAQLVGDSEVDWVADDYGVLSVSGTVIGEPILTVVQ